MKTSNRLFSRLLSLTLSVTIVAAAVYGLVWVNEQMTIRYQAVGIVLDKDGAPIPQVEALLLLEPPPVAGPQLDELFQREGVLHDRYGPNGQLKRAIGPTVGLSDHGGIFVVRVAGRVGPEHAIRLGMDTGGRPPYERAWLVLRREGHPDLTRTISILGWRTAPTDWGTFVNRLPRIQVSK